ncbi:MAG: hypothetical protein E7Z92_06740 [Cyanobacteria bacterium SIG31]|nr:hypothetical protein [Cyanobacteria bacterium SIG31]
MKIDKIQQNYNGNYAPQKRQRNVSFQRSGSSMAEKITEALPAKKVIEFMKKLEWMKGEIGGVAITAIGTGLVAPWPIAFNPFVKAPKGATKEEKQDVTNTKIYTALRQPISAVLAAIFQIGALKPIDKFLDSLYNNNEFARHFDIDTNQSLINSDGYVERQVKKQLKKEGITKASKGKEEFENLVKQRVEEIKDSQIDDVAEKIKNTHRIKIGESYLENHKLADFVNRQIDNYISYTEQLRVPTNGLTFYQERAQTLVENKNLLNEIFAPNKLPKESKELQEYIKGLLAKETKPELKQIFQEILDRPEEIQRSRIERTLERITKVESMCGGEFSPEKYLKAMQEKNAEAEKIIIDFRRAKIKDVKNATTETIEKAIKEVIEICHFDEAKNPIKKSVIRDTSTFSSSKENIVKKVYKDIVKQYKEHVKNSYKSHNQIWKIAIGVFITLPITCNALNWVYPRLVKALFPKLSESKKASDEKKKKGGI